MSTASTPESSTTSTASSSSLPLPPGGHEIVFYLAGYRTVHHSLYLAPGSTVKLHETMEGLPAGESSEPPLVVPPVPPPPVGSSLLPRTPRPAWAPPAPPPLERTPATTYGTFSLRVQPAGAEVMIDGERWVSSGGDIFVIQLATGSHHIDVFWGGYQDFSTEILVREGETKALNVSLTPL